VSDAVSEALDRLFAAPLDEFVSLRRELAAALKKAGDVASSRAVAAATKPSRTAWALNQVARRRPELVKAALDAHEAAQRSQKEGAGESMRSSARLYRERVATVIEAAGSFVEEDGSELGPAHGRRIGATLQAIAGGGDAAQRDALVEGRLVADVDLDDPFAGVEIEPGVLRERAARNVGDGAGHRGPSSPHRGSDDLSAARTRAADRQAREASERARREAQEVREKDARAKAIAKQREHIAALEAEVKGARAAAREAEVIASRAQTEAERARRAVEAIDKRLEEARRELRALT
jgi:hypothetical protein